MRTIGARRSSTAMAGRREPERSTAIARAGRNRPAGGSGRCTKRIDRPWRDSGSVDHAGLHRGERLLRAQSGIDICNLDPRGRHLHGGAARVQGRHDPGKQHRSDSRVGCRNAFGDHLRLARLGDHRLVDRLPVLDVGVDLRAGRRPGRDVFNPAETRARDRIGLAVSGRRGVRRSAEGWGWRHR